MSDPRYSSARPPDGVDGRSLDASAFADLVRPYMMAMTRLAARLGPTGAQDDVVQEALVRAWRKRSQYDARRGPLVNWLLAIVANEARRAGRSSMLPIRMERGASATELDGHVDVELAVRRLAPRQRLAIDCFYFARLSIAETAAVMGCSEGTVKSTLADARAKLRALLEVPA